jgi:hypothetical protein
LPFSFNTLWCFLWSVISTVRMDHSSSNALKDTMSDYLTSQCPHKSIVLSLYSAFRWECSAKTCSQRSQLCFVQSGCNQQHHKQPAESGMRAGIPGGQVHLDVLPHQPSRLHTCGGNFLFSCPRSLGFCEGLTPCEEPLQFRLCVPFPPSSSSSCGLLNAQS